VPTVLIVLERNRRRRVSGHDFFERIHPRHQRNDRRADHIRHQAVIEIGRMWIARPRANDRLTWHADDDRICRDRFHDDRVRADARICANRDRAENFRARANDDAILQRGMAFAFVERRAAPISAVSPITTPMP